MDTRPDRCPKCGYPNVVATEVRGGLIGGSQDGHCPRCRTELVRALGTPFWRVPTRRRHRSAVPRTLSA